VTSAHHLRCTVVTSFGILPVYWFLLHATYDYHQLMLDSQIHTQTSPTQFIPRLTKCDKINAGLKAIQTLKHEIFESYSPPPLSNYSISEQHAEFQPRCSNHQRSDSHRNSLPIITFAVRACLTSEHTSCPPDTKRAVPVWAQVCSVNVNSLALVVCNSRLGQEHIPSVLQ